MSRAIPFFGDRLKIHLPVIFMSTTGSQGFVPQPNMIIYCIQTTRWSCSPRICWNCLNCLVPETRVSHTDIPYLVLLYFCFDLKTSMSLNMCHVRVASNGLIAGPSQLRRKIRMDMTEFCKCDDHPAWYGFDRNYGIATVGTTKGSNNSFSQTNRILLFSLFGCSYMP